MNSRIVFRANASGNEHRPRKKLRKGTHSCFECKRRKVRCIFPSDGRRGCIECEIRGNACVGQDFEGDQDQMLSKKKNVRDRIGRLEAMVETLVRKVESQGQPVDEHQTSAAEVLENMAMGALTPSSEASLDNTGEFENAPLLSLFDNTVLSLKQRDLEGLGSPSQASPSSTAQTSLLDSITGNIHGRQERTSKALRALLPPEQEMRLVFDRTGEWWNTWATLYPFFVGDVESGSIHEFAAAAMSNGRPTQLVRVLICVAVSLQQLPTHECERLGLSILIDDLLQRYMYAAQRLVTSHDEMLSDIDGIDCLLLQARFHVNMGQPRQAWLLIRRAVSIAQLLGIHRERPDTGQVPVTVAERRKKRLWQELFSCDRFLSLLLGLPYSAWDKYIESGFQLPPQWGPDFEQHYKIRLSVVCGHIIELNQGPDPATFASMIEIDQELDQLEKCAPDGWWGDTPSGSLNHAKTFERLVIQFWHLHVKLLLHLPFMLRAVTDRRYEYSKLVSLNSARKMIKRYALLGASTKRVTYRCKVLDFEAFIATVILVLNLLGDGGTLSALEQQTESADWVSVDEMIELLREATLQPGSVVAVQAVKVLETLRTGRNCGSDFNNGKHVKLAIPFLGTITIGKRSQVGNRCSRTGTPVENLPTPDTTLSSEISEAMNSADWAASLDPLVNEPLVSFSSSMYLPATTGSEFNLAPTFGGDDTLQHGGNNFDLDQDWNWFLDDPYRL